MGYTTWILVAVFSISFALFLGGYNSALNVIIENGVGSSEGMTALTTSLLSAFIISVGGSVAYSLLGSSYSVTFVIPALFISSFLFTFLLAPITVLYALPLPTDIQYLLFGTIGIILIAAFMQFVRGANS